MALVMVSSTVPELSRTYLPGVDIFSLQSSLCKVSGGRDSLIVARWLRACVAALRR